MMENLPNLTFIVGQEKRLSDIIGRAEIEPLLRSAIQAGLVRAVVLDENNLPLSASRELDTVLESDEICHKLLVEGEPCGSLNVSGRPNDLATAGLALLLRNALQLTLNNNLKRMLTTEIHTSVVQESYEQLVEANRCLTESEARYRHLASSLEKQVEERTVELQKAYSRLLQQEKMASVGQLAAGMAHEINNPNGFILSNLKTFQKYADRMKEMLELFRSLVSTVTPIENLRQLSEARWQGLKLDLILEDSGMLLAQSLDGAERIKKIVSDLRSFSHVDESDLNDADLNSELERTLSVITPQLYADATVATDFSPLPRLRCNPALVSQALLSLLQNSIQSRKVGLELQLKTRCQSGRVFIVIADNGCGIPAEHLNRVFDPFFTTRDVGAGTGMGLTVVREIISSLGGTVEIESTQGSGTTVTLAFPVPGDR